MPTLTIHVWRKPPAGYWTNDWHMAWQVVCYPPDDHVAYCNNGFKTKRDALECAKMHMQNPAFIRIAVHKVVTRRKTNV